MATAPFSGAPLPEDPDLDDVPAVLASIFDTIDDLFVLKATNTTDRDAKYVTAPKGTIVATTSDSALWFKTSDTLANWLPIYRDTGWVTSGFSDGSGWTASLAQIRQVGPTVHLAFSTLRTGADIVPAATGVHAGNVAGDPTLLVIPATYWPTVFQVPILGAGSFGAGRLALSPDGGVRLYDYYPGATLSSGDSVIGYASWLLG